jgi:CheY-like chemotaxis protein
MDTRIVPPAPNQSTPPASDSAIGAEILIVEDDGASRGALIDILETEGYRVAWVSNGQAALHYLRGSSLPCLILLDLMMPEMGGAAFRREQLQHPVLAAIPVVVMGSVSDSPEQALAIAAAGYFVQPYHVNELLSTVGRYCRRNATGNPLRRATGEGGEEL